MGPEAVIITKLTETLKFPASIANFPEPSFGIGNQVVLWHEGIIWLNGKDINLRLSR